jgi:hypothetical protein
MSSVKGCNTKTNLLARRKREGALFTEVAPIPVIGNREVLIVLDRHGFGGSKVLYALADEEVWINVEHVEGRRVFQPFWTRIYR